MYLDPIAILELEVLVEIENRGLLFSRRFGLEGPWEVVLAQLPV